jgi:phospho-N-acetylmuramoyl-pentapeptide-transferase
MLYWLVQPWSETPGAGLFQYISFRSICAVATAFVLSLVFGKILIARFARTGLAEDIGKTDSSRLAELHKDKQGTPTMGGLFLVGGLLVAGVLWMRFDAENVFSWLALALIAWFAAIGFVDDWIKLKVEGRNGLSKRAKQLLLTVGALAVGLILHHFAGLEKNVGGPHLYFPFLKDYSWDLTVLAGVPFLIVCVLVLTGSANAVNFSDGLDGLATGCVVIASLAYAVIAYFIGRVDLSEYLLVAHVPGCGELTVLLGALLGASLAFLWYNAHPAQIFMGDVGSLALGGALGFVALVSRTELVLFVVGGVFVAEALSVIIQVIWFKSTGRRVFRCAPLHHHFQFGGMPETRLVVRIWISAALLALFSLVLFKIR